MNRSILILLLSLSTFLVVDSQSLIENGSRQLNAGIGLSGWGIPLYAGMDFGIQKDITLGFEGSFRSYNQRYTGTNYRSSIIGLSGNGNYHFNTILEIPAKWDLYAGLNIGYYIWSSPSDYPGTATSGFGVGMQVGGRYFIRKNLGLNLEFGGGNTFSGGKFGITHTF